MKIVCKPFKSHDNLFSGPFKCWSSFLKPEHGSTSGYGTRESNPIISCAGFKIFKYYALEIKSTIYINTMN